MPGSNNGTGCPIAFVCANCRSTASQGVSAFGPNSNAAIRDNRRWRTGRERKVTDGRRNIRMMMVHLEYVCECGHRGWSRHQGTLRLPHNGEVPEGPLFLAEKKARGR